MNKSKVLLFSTLVLANIMPTIGIPMIEPDYVEAATSTADVKTFSDLSETHPYYMPIMEMVKEGIISGYEDGTFKPNELISRQHAAILINNAIGIKENCTVSRVSRCIHKPSIFRSNAISSNRRGIHLDKQGNFNPSKPLTRVEMARIIAIAYDLKVKANYTFEDAKGKYVQALYSNGVTAGYEDNTFKPNEPLTRAHFALFMYQANNIDENFVAQPTGEEETLVIKMPSDSPIGQEYPYYEELVEKTWTDKFPLPPGYTDMTPREYADMLDVEQEKLLVKNKHITRSTFPINRETIELMTKGVNTKLTPDEWIVKNANWMGLSVDELKYAINEAIRTGKVIDGGRFALYFNFSTNSIDTTYRSPELPPVEY